jgi:hypothetical protein
MLTDVTSYKQSEVVAFVGVFGGGKDFLSLKRQNLGCSYKPGWHVMAEAVQSPRVSMHHFQFFVPLLLSHSNIKHLTHSYSSVLCSAEYLVRNQSV